MVDDPPLIARTILDVTAAATVRRPRRPRSRRGRGRPCGRWRPRRPGRGSARGPATPISSPIASATSRPTKSSSSSGPMGWPAPSFMHSSMACGRQPAGLLQLDGVEQEREQQAVDDEAGGVGDLDGGLAERRRTARACARGSPALAAAGKMTSTSFIFGHGVEDVQPDEAVGVRAGAPRARSTAARRWWWRRWPPAATWRSRSAIRRGLGVVDPRRSPRPRRWQRGQLGQVGHHADVLGLDLAAEPAADLLDRRPRAVRAALRSRPEHDLVGVPGGRGRQPARDRAASGDAQPLVHAAIS